MGLFGGFKAKFTGSSSNKKKTQEVVCLKYHIHSEFDAQDSLRPLQIKNEKENEVVHSQPRKKARNAVTKSAIFPESQASQSSSFSSTPQKSLSLTNVSNRTVNKQENGYADPITVSTTFTLPSNGNAMAVSDTEYRKTTEEHNGMVTEKVAVVTNNHLYTTDHNVKNEQHSQTILKKVSTYDEDGALTNGAEYTSSAEKSYLQPSSTSAKENNFSDQSTLIFMTQHSSRNSSFDKDMDTDDLVFTKGVLRSSDSNKLQEDHNDTTDGNFNINVVPNNASDDEVDYYKINVVKYDLNRTYSQSEDEQSIEEAEPRFTRMGYSSQAASIFFGEGEEIEVARPRKIQLTDDDDRRSSGADC